MYLIGGQTFTSAFDYYIFWADTGGKYPLAQALFAPQPEARIFCYCRGQPQSRLWQKSPAAAKVHRP
jgi:hypothetical protein